VEIVFETDAARDDLVVGYSIHDGLGAAVLSGWSPALGPLAGGRHHALLAIGRLPVAPGVYEVSMALLTGALDRPKYVYDMVLRFGRFTVAPFLADGRPIADWVPGWGRVIHDDSAVTVLSGPGSPIAPVGP
jgi:hypothetical protein